MKRAIAMLAVLLIVTGAFAACGKDNKEDKDSSHETMISPEDKISPTEAVDLETAKTEDSLYGTYKNDFYTMDVQAGEDGMTVFTVKSEKDGGVSYEWVLKGAYSVESNLVNYFSGVKTEITYDKNGAEKQRSTVYDNGSGRMLFENGGKIIWKNSFEDVEGSDTFTRVK